MARKQEGGLSAALARLDEVYGSTDMDVDEYMRRKGDLTRKYLDAPVQPSGFFARLAHGDREAWLKVGVVLVALFVLAVIAAIVISAIFAGPTFIGAGDD